MKSNVVLQNSGKGRLFPDANNNRGEQSKGAPCKGGPGGGGYGLRPRSERRGGGRRGPAGRQKAEGAAPLSKYRRRTANARERTRMREINGAFEALRCCVGGAESGPGAANERMTKISTLRLAARYIAALAAALEEPEPPSGAGLLRYQPVDLELSPELTLSPDISLSPDAPLSPAFPHEALSPAFPHGCLSPAFPDRSLSPFDPFFTEFS